MTDRTLYRAVVCGGLEAAVSNNPAATSPGPRCGRVFCPAGLLPFPGQGGGFVGAPRSAAGCWQAGSLLHDCPDHSDTAIERGTGETTDVEPSFWSNNFTRILLPAFPAMFISGGINIAECNLPWHSFPSPRQSEVIFGFVKQYKNSQLGRAHF